MKVPGLVLDWKQLSMNWSLAKELSEKMHSERQGWLVSPLRNSLARTDNRYDFFYWEGVLEVENWCYHWEYLLPLWKKTRTPKLPSLGEMSWVMLMLYSGPNRQSPLKPSFLQNGCLLIMKLFLFVVCSWFSSISLFP